MVESTESATSVPKKAKVTKAKKPKVAPSHPPVAKMVPAAISALKDRGGSSLAAIKKYIAANYKVDADKMSFFIRKYLKSAVANGSLVQTKGKGANGSFKISTGTKEPKKSAPKPKKSATIKATKPKKVSPPKKAPSTPKKTAKPKKAATKPKKSPAKKAKPAKKPASPKKPKAVKLAVKPKKAKASPKKKPAAKKSKK